MCFYLLFMSLTIITIFFILVKQKILTVKKTLLYLFKRLTDILYFLFKLFVLYSTDIYIGKILECFLAA